MKHLLKRGRLITFEGIDGSGKSTHLEKSRQLLSRLGFRVKVLREPGSTDIAERIRRTLLDKRSLIAPTTELLLYEAARADVTQKHIEPALQAGYVVLCDRFYDSTTAYQGYGRRLDIVMVKKLNALAVGRVTPDLTLLFDVDLATAMTRRGKKLDRLESESRAFFARVRNGYLAIARHEKTRVKVINSRLEVGEVFAQVEEQLLAKLNRAR